MVSALGRGVAGSIAAQRCGMSRASDCDHFRVWDPAVEGEVPLHAHQVREFSEGYEAAGRWVRLGAAALEDLIAGRRPAVGGTPRQRLRTGLIVIAPSWDEERFPVDPEPFERVPALLASQLKGEWAVQDIESLDGASAGTALALNRARGQIVEGRWDRALVLAVDSLVDSPSLDWLQRAGRLKVGDRPTGVIPGEAAVCVLVEAARPARPRGESALAIVRSCQSEGAPTEGWPSPQASGRALAGCINRALEACADRPFDAGFVIVNLNGEEGRAARWGTASSLLSRQPSFQDPRLVTPAQSFGETGVASGAIGICVAVQAFARGYSPTDDAVIVGMSDAGGAECIAVSRDAA